LLAADERSVRRNVRAVCIPPFVRRQGLGGTHLIHINDPSPAPLVVYGGTLGAGITMEKPCSDGRVKAIFQDSTLLFEVAADTTLENLCDLLARWGRGHGDAVLVEVAWLPDPAADPGV
jgi:hypothetical protein